MHSPTQHVLVVEDEEAIRRTLIEVLRMEGFEADQAATGDEAVEMLSGSVYDVLVTDYALPGKNGLELLEEALVRFPNIVGIVITGHGSIEGAVEAMKK